MAKKKRIFGKKKKFEKEYKIWNTKDDFGMKSEHQFALAADPSKETLYGIMAVVTTKPDELDEMTEEELEELDEAFYHFVSELIIECDIDGLDFSDAKTTRESFFHPDVDWHFLFSVCGYYVGTLIDTHRTLGKVLRQSTEAENSGNEKSQKENTSTSESGTESTQKPQKK